MKYWTKTPGTGGKVLSEDDFVVSELPAKKFLTKYERKNGRVSPVSGPFFLYRLKKRGMTTKAAVASPPPFPVAAESCRQRRP